MVCLQFYEAIDGGPELDRSDIDMYVESLTGAQLTGAVGDPYRSGQWHDVHTGARCDIDLGDIPVEADHVHPPKSYEGWRSVGLTIHVPLAGPHWLCVEVLQWVEKLLQHFQQLRVLDTEDTQQDGADGPGTWHRPRVLASWEKLHQAQLQGRTDLCRMGRLASVCLWRYRRERAQGRSTHPELIWPDALVVLDQTDNCARSAMLLPTPLAPMALPPVELIVITTANGTSVIPAEIVSACGGDPLSLGQSQLVTPSDKLATVIAAAKTLPIDRFKALGDHDWSD